MNKYFFVVEAGPLPISIARIKPIEELNWTFLRVLVFFNEVGESDLSSSLGIFLQLIFQQKAKEKNTEHTPLMILEL